MGILIDKLTVSGMYTLMAPTKDILIVSWMDDLMVAWMAILMVCDG